MSLIVRDILDNAEMLVDYQPIQQKTKVNGEYAIAFVLFKTDKNTYSYPMVIEENIIEYDGQDYRIKKIDEKPIGNTVVKTVTANHIFFDLIDDYQYTATTGYLSIIEALDIALVNTDYTYQVIDAFNQYQFENFGNDNRLSLVQTILNRFGAEVEIDNKRLTFRQKIGNKTDFQFRFKHNTKTITKSIDTSSLSTYIKGYGAVGIETEYTSPNWTKYGKLKHAEPVRDERYTTVEGLLDRLKKEIQDEPRISFTIDFLDLRDQGYPYDTPQLGDEVYVIYEPLNVDITARILELNQIKDHNGKVIKTEVTLSNFKNSATDIMTSFSQTKKQVDGILEGKEKLPFNALDAEVQRMTNILKNSESEIEWASDGSLIFRDKTDPNKIVIINSSGLGVSNNNLISILSAITGDGILADRITTGTLNTNNVTITNNNKLTIDGSGLSVKDASNVERVKLGEYASGKYGVKITDGEIIGTKVQTSQPPVGVGGYFSILDGGSNIEGRYQLANGIQRKVFQLVSGGNGGTLTVWQGGEGVGQVIGYFFGGGEAGTGQYMTIKQNKYNDDWTTTNPESLGVALVSNGASLFVKESGDQILCDGNLSMAYGHSKNAMELSEQYGVLYLHAHESPDARYFDEDNDYIVNGECRVELDPAFLDCIEPNIEGTEWIITCTPYAPINLYVSEIGTNYIVFKDTENRSGKFSWRISGIRKNFTNNRFIQPMGDTTMDEAMNTNWEDAL